MLVRRLRTPSNADFNQQCAIYSKSKLKKPRRPFQVSQDKLGPLTHLDDRSRRKSSRLFFRYYTPQRILAGELYYEQVKAITYLYLYFTQSILGRRLRLAAYKAASL
ncbi:unnamed protein product [Oikopleura dioica]|uniref:Uncharacterized protein n=1 Tax=Oikopleura dioica TaxID=34765 RepID=E4XRE0_OIKDI|nr:unnamed protein product [Oikopleura dioica]